VTLKQAVFTIEELLKLGKDLEQRIVNLGDLEKPDLAIVLMFGSEKTYFDDHFDDLEPKITVLRLNGMGMPRTINLDSICSVTNLKSTDFTRARLIQQDNEEKHLASQLLFGLGC
jgi:hypothetical protein